jgi:hypothetical protein
LSTLLPHAPKPARHLYPAHSLPRGHCIADGLASSAARRPNLPVTITFQAAHQNTKKPTNHLTATPVRRCSICSAEHIRERGKAVIRQCVGNIVIDGLEHRQNHSTQLNLILAARHITSPLHCIAITNDVEIRAGTMTKFAQRNGLFTLAALCDLPLISPHHRTHLHGTPRPQAKRGV